MGAVSNAAALAVDPQFRNMSLATAVYVARTVFTEDPATSNHDRRMWYATQVIRDPAAFLDPIAWLVASDPTIAQAVNVTQVSELALLASVTGAWDYLAGTGPINF